MAAFALSESDLQGVFLASSTLAEPFGTSRTLREIPVENLVPACELGIVRAGKLLGSDRGLRGRAQHRFSWEVVLTRPVEECALRRRVDHLFEFRT